MAALEPRIFELVQDERHKIDPNAKTLALDPELIGVARAHSPDMAAKNYFAHKSPDGETSAELIMDEDAKLQGLARREPRRRSISTSATASMSTSSHIVSSTTWLASQSHKDNLAFPRYDRTGVGAAVSGDTIYVTQLFATDLGLPPVQDDPKSRKVTEFPNAKAAKDAPPMPLPRPQ